jgi:SAM-dependent methyltransferase
MECELSHRLETFFVFVTAHVDPPARVLEVGCGRGELARALAAAGYDVTAIDPEAPDGPIFRRVTLEEFSDEAPHDAVVASVSLHHVEALEPAFDKVKTLLRPGGTLILEEFAKERFAGATAAWYFHQRLARLALGFYDHPVPADFRAFFDAWQEEHADIHSSDEIRAELEPRFEQQTLSWGPYLYDYWLHDELEPLERELIEAGKIEPTGYRYVGQTAGNPAAARP